jgi:hemolysin activation/secretion protein
MWLNGNFWVSAAEPAANGENQAEPGYEVETYMVVGGPKLSMDVVFPILSRYTGPKVSLGEIVKAAAALQAECQKEGYAMTSVAISREHIANGVVTMNLFQTALPQIVISGVRYFSPTNNTELPAYSPPVLAVAHPTPEAVATNTPPPINYTQRVSPEKNLAARTRLFQEMAELDKEQADHRIHVATTNAGPRFDVEHYLILGNTALAPDEIVNIMTNIDGAFGTNVSFEGIQTVAEQLQDAYRDRGFPTVAVTLPQQKLADATVKIQVLEGRLSAINVTGNRFFSSNNVMRALPSLRTNILINAPILQAELNRANANQDRQIYPVVGPGPEPGTSELTLKVKDQMPLHAKVELNNENSPGTPEMRVNSSAVYNNLWQLEHSVGFQYGFSPEVYKPGDQWRFYDKPEISYYSGYYRLPLGEPESLEDRIEANPGSFGYNEETHKFNLPPVSNRPDLTLFASRSTTDTGVATTYSSMITTNGSNPGINRQDVEESPTKNEDIGAHLDYPLPSSGNFQSSLAGGVDFKVYEILNDKTNLFLIVQTNYDANNMPILPPISSTVPSIVPETISRIEYLPLSLRYDGNWRDDLGSGSFGLGVSFNTWFDSHYSTLATNGVSYRGSAALTNITGSAQSSGYWVVVNPSFSHTFLIDNWTTILRADGQWASEPLISPEQFGAGGVNSVRGYHEGEVFGDDGWHVSLEQQTPLCVVGNIRANTPLTLRGSVYMDYADVYLIDPQGRPFNTPLWGTGLGISAFAGSHWQAQMLFSVPLVSSPSTPAHQPIFDFSLTAQF